MSSLRAHPAGVLARRSAAFTPGERLLLEAFVAHIRGLSWGAAIEWIVAFGSRARGEGDEDSDLDLAIFLSTGAPPSMERDLTELAETVQEGWEDLPHLRPVCIRAGDRTRPALLHAIETEGLVLWAKTSD